MTQHRQCKNVHEINLYRKHNFRWFFRHMVQRGGVFFLNCQCGVWKHVTLCDPKQCQNVEEPLLAFSNVFLNATIFKGDLLASYESPTISTISDRNFIKQSWDKTCKIRWQSPMTFRRDFFRPSFSQIKWPNIDNVKTYTKSNLFRKHDFGWFFRYMIQQGSVSC